MTAPTIYKTPAGERAVMALYDEALTRWPVPCETRTLPARHGEAFAIISGPASAPPLVLLHGAGTNSTIWAGDVAIYSRDRRVVAVDLLGEAGRSAPARPAWDGSAYAEWLDDVLAGLGLGRVSLLGLSQGGWAALKYAVARPEAVEALVLLCPGGVVRDHASFLPRAIWLSLWGRRGNRRLVRLLYGRLPVPAGVEAIIAEVSSHFKPRIGVLPLFTDPELARLTMPVLLIGGTRDIIRDNAAIATRLHAHLPRLSAHLLPGAGHALPDTTGLVTEFLA